jgi:hypothetical protein
MIQEGGEYSACHVCTPTSRTLMYNAIVRYMCLGVSRHLGKIGKPPFIVNMYSSNCCTAGQQTQKQQTLSHKILPLFFRAQMIISCSHLFSGLPSFLWGPSKSLCETHSLFSLLFHHRDACKIGLGIGVIYNVDRFSSSIWPNIRWIGAWSLVFANATRHMIRTSE